jgi:alkylation response protein AidB-like acyl-CoA dehydrogenase
MSFYSAADDDFLSTVTAFVTKEIEPVAEMIDRESRIPAGLTARLSALDLFTIGVPAVLGGCGAGIHTALGCVAAMASTSPAVALLLADAHAAAAAVDPAIGETGRALVGEPVAIADSDAVTASGSGDRVLLSGAAPRVEHAAFADLLIMVSGPAGSEQIHLVARRSPGVGLGSPLATTGLRGADARALTLESVPARLLGGPAEAETLRRWQAMGLAAISVGIARRALTEAQLYAADRRQFGRPIAEFPAVQAILDGCEDLVAAGEAELGALGQAETLGVSRLRRAVRAARRAARGAVAVCLDAVQVHGGYGYVTGAPVERSLRDAVSLRAISSQLFLRAAESESRQLTLGLLPDLTR